MKWVRAGQEIQGDALGVLICLRVHDWVGVRVGVYLRPKEDYHQHVCLCAHRDLDFSSTTQLWIRKPLRERLIGFANGEGWKALPLQPPRPIPGRRLLLICHRF